MADKVPIVNRLLSAVADSENDHPGRDDAWPVDLSRQDALDAVKRIVSVTYPPEMLPPSDEDGADVLVEIDDDTLVPILCQGRWRAMSIAAQQAEEFRRQLGEAGYIVVRQILTTRN